MHNQRILYSSKKERDNTKAYSAKDNSIPISGNKENTLRMLNHQVADESREANLSMIKFDYDGKRGIPSRGRNIQSMAISSSQNSNAKLLQSAALTNELRDNRGAEYNSSKGTEYNSNRGTEYNIRDVEYNNSINDSNQGKLSCGRSPLLSEKHQQIQAYTEKLLNLNAIYQEQIIDLKQKLTVVRSQHERAIADNIKYRVTMEKGQQESQYRFNSHIEKLVVELKEILSAKELMELQYNNYIKELVEQHNNQLLHKNQQLAKAEQFFKSKLSSYKSTLTINNQQTQKLYFQTTQSKIKLIKQIDQLNYNLDKEKAAKRQLQKANEDLVKIVKQLEKDNTETKNKLEIKQMEVFKIEKQKNQIIIHLKLQNKQLIEINTNLQQQFQSTNNLLSNKTIQLIDSQKQLSITNNQLKEVTQKLVSLNYQLEEQKREKVKAGELMAMKIESMSRQLDKYQSLVAELQSANKKLSQDNADKQSMLQYNQTQLASVTTQLQTLRQLQSKLTKQLSQLQDLNKKYKSDNIDLLQQLQLSTLQNKSLKQEKLSKDNQLNVLEQMCQRLQNKLKAGDRKGEEEVGKLIDENESLKREIEFISQQYERKLQQKQVKWQNRLETIQNQIQTLMTEKIMIRNNQHIIEPHSRQRNRQLKSPMIIKNTLNQPQYLNSDKIKQNYFNDNLAIQKQKIKYYEQAEKRMSQFRNSGRQS